MAKKRIGILTGGGDVAGLNAVIKSVTYRGSENDIEVVGLRRGWEALTHLNLEDPNSRSHYIIPLNRENTRTIDCRGGTVLHSSRINPSKIQKAARPSRRQRCSSVSEHQGRHRDQDVGPHRAGAGDPFGARHRTLDRHRRRSGGSFDRHGRAHLSGSDPHRSRGVLDQIQQDLHGESRVR
jgi:hypothetical protein